MQQMQHVADIVMEKLADAQQAIRMSYTMKPRGAAELLRIADELLEDARQSVAKLSDL